MVVPRSSAALNSNFERIVVGWAMVAAFIFCVASLVVAQLSGVSISGTARLGAVWLGFKWTNENTTAVPAATLILLCMVGTYVPRSIRVVLVSVAAYVLLLTQSRTTLVSLFIVSLFYVYLIMYKQPKRVFSVLGWLLGAIMVLISFFESFLALGPVQRIIERTQRTDPTTGRLEIYQTAIDRIAAAPLFGNGYGSTGSRFENGYLSMMVESGVFGLAIYTVFMWHVLSRAWQMRHWTHDPRAQGLARSVLLFGLFLCVRALGERNHGFQVSNLISNIWILLAGYLLVYRETSIAAVKSSEPERIPTVSGALPNQA
jgi:O-antigen ligase